uniref:Kinesin family member 11 n=1 Tax=Crocodylus porosus TaxID=8502 RepID=A0A7M4FBE7_CROPO
MASFGSQGGAKKEEKGKNIQVVVRCRPFNTSERKANSFAVVDCDQGRKEVSIRTGGVTDKTSRKTYTFDMVFGAQAKQIDVYRSVVCPILDEVIMGYNCTVFAYGQTGTGKTFTMEGERSPNDEYTWEEDPLAGIIPRTLHQIFEKLSENGTEFSVKVSLLEIYNEELFDLLTPSPDVGERLQMFDDPRNKRGVIIKGLEEITVHNKDEVYQILERGAAKRTTAATYMNAYSSRSHSVFSITIHMKETTIDGEELVKIGKLNLETLSTLEYAHRAKNILNKPEVNQKLTKRALIKEYTEEIERLKRDLAAVREKNGVYISVENYDALTGKLTVQEEQIAEYIEKISAMEEEMKRVTELFTVNKNELEQCKTDLESRERQLEETQKNLQETKVQLTEEEYVVSVLESTEEKLHGTASELLSTVEETTKDVSSLHAKLDRKKAVDQHNAKAQKTFAGQMNILFSKMKDSVTENGLKQQQVLDFYVNVIGDLLSASSSATSVITSLVSSSFTSIKEMVSTEVSRVSEKILEQETLSIECKAELQRSLDEHKSGLGKALSSMSPVVDLVLGLNCQFQNNINKYSAIADKMESHKEELSASFRELRVTLNKLQKETNCVLAQLQDDCENLKEKVEMAKLAHTKSTNQLVSSLQSQLNLLLQETQQNLSGIVTTGRGLKTAIANVQENVHLQTTDLVTCTTSSHDKFITSLENFSQELRQLNSENQIMLEESSEHSEQLRGSFLRVCHETDEWSELANTKIIHFTDQQMSTFSSQKQQLQSLQMNVDVGCQASVGEVTNQIDRQKSDEERALKSLLDQIKADQDIFAEQKLALCDEALHGLIRVNGFLQEELKVDVSTGTTPQRRDYLYPVEIVRTEPRELLLEQLRQKQLELVANLNSAAKMAEENMDQDSLEEEEAVQESNESVISDKSFLNASASCQTNGGVPFFQQKKSHKKDKENKSISTRERSKVEDTAEQSFLKLKTPLGALN